MEEDEKKEDDVDEEQVLEIVQMQREQLMYQICEEYQPEQIVEIIEYFNKAHPPKEEKDI